MVPEHLDVEPIDDVELLAKQQRTVAPINEGGVVVAAGVDLPPGLQGGRVDDPSAVNLLDLRQSVGNVRLVHRRLILEDLLLHREKRRLVEAEVAGATPREVGRDPPQDGVH